MGSPLQSAISQSLGSGSNWWDKMYYSVVAAFALIAAIDSLSLFSQDGSSCVLHQAVGTPLEFTADLGESQMLALNQCCDNRTVYLPWQALGALITVVAMLLPFAYWRFISLWWTLSLRPSINAARDELGAEAAEMEALLELTGAGDEEAVRLELSRVPKGTRRLLRTLSSLPDNVGKGQIWKVHEIAQASDSGWTQTAKILLVGVAAVALVLGFAVFLLFLATMIIFWILPSLGPALYASLVGAFGKDFTARSRYVCSTSCTQEFPEFPEAVGICHRPREDRAVVGLAIASAVVATPAALYKIWWILHASRAYVWLRTVMPLLGLTERLCDPNISFEKVEAMYSTVMHADVRSEGCGVFDNPVASTVEGVFNLGVGETSYSTERTARAGLKMWLKRRADGSRPELTLPQPDESPFWVSKAGCIRHAHRTMYDKRGGAARYWDALWDRLWLTNNHLGPLYGVQGVGWWLQEPAGWSWGLPQMLCWEYIDTVKAALEAEMSRQTEPAGVDELLDALLAAVCERWLSHPTLGEYPLPKYLNKGWKKLEVWLVGDGLHTNWKLFIKSRLQYSRKLFGIAYCKLMLPMALVVLLEQSIPEQGSAPISRATTPGYEPVPTTEEGDTGMGDGKGDGTPLSPSLDACPQSCGTRSEV